jgi:hypothetical protein
MLSDRVESLIPLISCMSISGPQYPLLTRLRTALHQLYPNPTDTVALFMLKIEDIIRKSESSATRPMFDERDERERERRVMPERAILDPELLGRELDLGEEDSALLREAVRRLEKATRSGEEPSTNERGVRQL